MRAIAYNKTTKIIIFCIGILASVGLAYFVSVSNLIIAVLSSVGFLALILRVRLISLIALGITVGLLRGAAFTKQIDPLYDVIGQKVTVQAKVDSPSSYGDKKQLEFDVTHVKLLQPYQADLPIKMQISGFGENTVLRGDVITATGKSYKRRGSKQAGISFAQIAVVSHDTSPLQQVRRNFLAGMTTAIPEPHDQFAIGLLVGQKSDLPKYVVDTLQIVGLSHIIAVSGYNLTILVDVSKKRFSRGSKLRGTLLSCTLVLLFVAMVGSSASIQRAALVSLLTIAAAHYGRSIKPLVLITFAAAVTVILNPLSIWSDVGWYLSFLAFFGVLVISPYYKKDFIKIKSRRYFLN
jgi:competence protein ComEC